jgi:hypothetical protein
MRANEEMARGPEEWQDKLRSLQQWVCELLIKNQELRMALESATAPENGDRMSKELSVDRSPEEICL